MTGATSERRQKLTFVSTTAYSSFQKDSLKFSIRKRIRPFPNAGHRNRDNQSVDYVGRSAIRRQHPVAQEADREENSEPGESAPVAK